LAGLIARLYAASPTQNIYTNNNDILFLFLLDALPVL